MNCMLLIDQRENATDGGKLVHDMIRLREWQPGELAVSKLSLFDIMFEQNGVARAAFERKIASDVLASHRDGRWGEQLARIVEYANEHPTVVVGFIIEGNLDSLDYGQFTPAHIRHSIWALTKYNISVVYTRSLDETCQYLLYMRSEFSKALTVEEARKEAADNRLLFQGKKRDVTPDSMLFQTLRMIGGISAKHAIAISSKYNNLCELASALKHNPKLFVGTQIAGGRKIGKDLSAKIHRMFLAIEKE
jgi:ERCC4-type nuclease